MKLIFAFLLALPAFGQCGPGQVLAPIGGGARSCINLNSIPTVTTLPATCTPGGATNVVYLSAAYGAYSVGVFTCTASNVWTAGTGGANIWTRTGTTISPTNAGDSVAIGTTVLPLDPTNVVTASTFTFGSGTFTMGIYWNQNATAGTAVTGTLPVAAANWQFCLGNSYNGSAANTGALTVQTSASGQFIIYTDGTLSASGGYVSSAGAAREMACFIGVDSTHWAMTVNSGTWAKY